MVSFSTTQGLASPFIQHTVVEFDTMSYSTHFVSLLAAIEKLWYGELVTDNVFLTNTEQQKPHPKKHPLF